MIVWPLFALHSPSWEVQSLAEVCRRGGGDVQTGPFGSQLHASDYVEQGIPSVMPQNIGDNQIRTDGIARITPEDANRLARYLFQPGDVIYSRRGDVERRALVRERESGWLCGTGCLRVRFGNGVVHPPYAAYYLGHPEVRAWIVRHAIGATMPNLNTSILGALPFVLPSMPEQRSIAYILGTLDDKIELNRRQNETLEAMARALFKSWFVDFDPVRAKAEGRNTGLPKHIANLIPDDFEDSELGLIPKGWRVAKLSEVVKVVLGQSPPGNTYNESGHGFPLINGPVQFGARFPIRSLWTNAKRVKLCQNDDLIFCVRGSTTGCRVTSDGTYVLGRGVCAIRSKHASGQPFVTQLIDFELSKMLAKITGSVFPNLSGDDISGHSFIYPPTALIAYFGGIVGAFHSCTRSKESESQSLADLRDSLLPKLLSGNVQLGDSERLMKGADGC